MQDSCPKPTPLGCRPVALRRRLSAGVPFRLAMLSNQLPDCKESSACQDKGLLGGMDCLKVDEATFQAVNAVLDGRRLREPRGTVLYVLRAIAYCKCGAKLEPLNNGRRYYRCKARCG
jgi:hypothetical protein